MARLIIIGPEGRQEAEIGRHNTLGRHPNNTVQILDRIVSKEHCHIDMVDGRYVLKDLGSLNGAFVHGERVGDRVLNHGDESTLGSTRILSQDSGGVPAAAGASSPAPAPAPSPGASTPASAGAPASPVAPPPGQFGGAAATPGPAVP